MAEQDLAAELLYHAWEQTVGLWVVITKYYECDPATPVCDQGIQLLKSGLDKPLTTRTSYTTIFVSLTCLSGEVERARYPAHLNPNVAWPRDAKAGGLIQ